MDREILVKTIRKEFPDKISAGIAWFTFITAINGIKLTKRELELMAFINLRGTISSVSAKDEFCKLFDSSTATVSNMVSRLSSLNLLVKENGKTRVNKNLKVDFDKEFVMRLFLNVKPDQQAFPEGGEETGIFV